MRGDLSAVPAFISNKFPDFAARLDSDGPLSVAVSGGGDSVALLYALVAWRKRPLEVFCVDHGLNPLSPQWTQSVADHAARLGVGFTALHWGDEKPQTGLSAAARLARHRLLAEAARQKGISVLCLAHTADDIAEAKVMRGQGSSVGAPKVWAPSPVWPEGRGVFLYRPFLDIRRDALRDYLRGIGVGWIDDPANESPHSLRARTRKALQDEQTPVAPVETGVQLSPVQLEMLLYRSESLAPLGLIAFQADRFHALPNETAVRLLATAAVCAGGGDKLPRQEKVSALLAQLPSGKAQTLSGARLYQADGVIFIGREAGDIGRNRAGQVSMTDGETVWDGRFAIRAVAGEIVASHAARAQLSDDDRTWLSSLPAMARGSQPVLEQKDNLDKPLLTNPALRHFEVKCLVFPRFRAAMGMIRRESDVTG
ncbi:MAG: tRNA lysidine(34) synthetase TilS [Asticcacaulis sp.]|uniref:tRNA lysidine(34) synthetase TilS n=1 Tax=Asticcacaulis sp. TaxID=1872648 RepID=UPI0039E53964